MNRNIAKGELQKIKAAIKRRWAKITDNELKRIEADFDELEGVLKEVYGLKKEEAKKEAQKFWHDADLTDKETLAR